MRPLRPCYCFFFFLMIRRPPRSTLDRSSAASDVYKRQVNIEEGAGLNSFFSDDNYRDAGASILPQKNILYEGADIILSLIHISEPTRPY